MMKTLLIAGLLLAPAAAPAQDTWTRVGAIGRTSMYMDTTTIVRDGNVRKVWIKSVDPEARLFVAGRDTVTFDAVVGLNVLDCASRTYTVPTVGYFHADEQVLSIPDTHGTPRPVRRGSFTDAVYRDLCERR